MRLLEILMLITVILLFILLNYKKRRQLKYLFILPFFIMILHIMNEQIRYQFYLLYLLITIFFIIGILQIMRILPNIQYRILKFITITILFITILLSYAFPVYSMLEPTGDYQIGTLTYEVTDQSRKEIYSDNEIDNRRIKYQIWYPTDDTDGLEQAYWLNEGKEIARGVAKTMGFPSFMLDQTSLVTSHAYKDATLSTQKDKYPVVIISHGWRGFHDLHADIAEELSSHGYIVISIDHTYGSSATVFDDEVIYNNPDILPKRGEPNFLNAANQLVNTYSEDIILILDELETLNQNHTLFKNHLNLDNIGLVGHSTGGGATVKAALTDSRIDAVVGLDAWVEPINMELLNQGLTVPNLFIRSEEWETGPNNDYLYSLLENNQTDGLLYQIKGTKHYDFSMSYMYSPLSKVFNITGEHDGKYVATINRDLILNFFDQNLRNDELNWNNLIQTYPEINQISYK